MCMIRCLPKTLIFHRTSCLFLLSSALFPFSIVLSPESIQRRKWRWSEAGLWNSVLHSICGFKPGSLKIRSSSLSHEARVQETKTPGVQMDRSVAYLGSRLHTDVFSKNSNLPAMETCTTNAVLPAPGNQYFVGLTSSPARPLA